MVDSGDTQSDNSANKGYASSNEGTVGSAGDSKGGWAGRRELSSRIWLRLLRRVYRSLGRKTCGILLYPISLYFLLFARVVRHASLDFQARVDVALASESGAQPRVSCTPNLIRSYFHILEFARCVLDKFAGWQGDIRRSEVVFHGKQELRALIDAGKGAVLLSAHVGNTEILRAVATELGGVAVNALMYTAHNPAFNEILDEAVRDPTLRVIPSENFGPEMLGQLRDCVGRGEIVAMLGDRVMPGSPEKSIPVPFLGENAMFPAGPFIVASLLECPVFLVFCFRLKDGSYEANIESFAPRLELPRARRAEALKVVMGKFVSRLEVYCKKYPLQWFNFFPFWG